LARGGYIITISPTAIGIEVVPIVNFSKKVAKLGKKLPMATPKAIARKIHKVRKRSNKDNLGFVLHVVIFLIPPIYY
jgi:hypothetical protein